MDKPARASPSPGETEVMSDSQRLKVKTLGRSFGTAGWNHGDAFNDALRHLQRKYSSSNVIVLERLTQSVRNNVF